MRTRIPSRPCVLAWLFVFAILTAGCGPGPASTASADLLQVMSLTSEAHAAFEADFFRDFSARRHVKTQYLTDVGGTVNGRLRIYQPLLRDHATRPDLLEIDVVWPSMFANDLLDLKPFLGEALKSFSPEILANFTVNGRLVALPTFVDVGMLYYRRDLLEKYGFHHPPATWQELESMALVIQTGERRAGNADFWGFTWQGGAFEGLTCNALEWQSSIGAGNIIAADRTVQVRDPAFLTFLSRATNWIGTISPPGEAFYREADSGNLWEAGQVAFMRSWASSFMEMSRSLHEHPQRLGVAPLPAGPGGHRGTLGGQGIAISKYAANRKLAISALLELTSEANDLARVFRADSLPVRIANQNRPEVRNKSLLHASSAELLNHLVLRPAVVAGAEYAHVSHAYFTAVNSVLRREQTPAVAMEALEKELQTIVNKRLR